MHQQMFIDLPPYRQFMKDMSYNLFTYSTITMIKPPDLTWKSMTDEEIKNTKCLKQSK
jgi:hypothetical protein